MHSLKGLGPSFSSKNPCSNHFRLVLKRLKNHQEELWVLESWVFQTNAPSRYLGAPSSSRIWLGISRLRICDITWRSGTQTLGQETGLKPWHTLCMPVQGLGWAPYLGCVSSHLTEPLVYVEWWRLAHPRTIMASVQSAASAGWR